MYETLQALKDNWPHFLVLALFVGCLLGHAYIAQWEIRTGLRRPGQPYNPFG